MRKTLVLQCPINSGSGYGAHSRDIAKSILNIIDPDKWELIIVPTLWGSTSDNVLHLDNEEDAKLLNCIITKKMTAPPDIFFQVALPNESNPIGLVNILCTAGIETTLAGVEWIEGCNKMDMIIVPSEHSANVLRKSKWEKRDQQTSEVIEDIIVKTPIHVLCEGVDPNIYHIIESNEDSRVNKAIDGIDSDFAFLFVGHWLPGEFGQDRKNLGATLKSFIKVFGDKDNQPALILKTALINASEVDLHACTVKLNAITKAIVDNLKIKKLPPIYLLHGEYTDSEMNELYNHIKVKCMISTTRGEGYGRPLAEFSMVEKPILASNWSGQLDFLNKKYVTLINGKVTQVHPSAVWDKIILPEAGWFSVDEEEVEVKMLAVYKDYNTYKQKAIKQTKYFKSEFLMINMEQELKNLLDSYLQIPEQIEFKLPTLKTL